VSAGLERALEILWSACGDRVRTAHRLAPLTTFRVGGPAAIYLEPESDADLAAAGEAVRTTAIPHVVLGKGSNVLVADAGFPGLVIRLGRAYRWSSVDGSSVRAGAATPFPSLAGVALAHGLSGLEFAIAIPGTVGGAVRMNAGAHGAELSGVLEWVDVFRLLEGAADRLPATEVGLSYRRSSLPGDGVVIAAGVALAPDDPDRIRARMDQAREQRRRTQPLAEANCGSVFKNPPGDHAGRLIEAAGGKGLRVGGAAVSTKHANFIVTSDGAAAADVLDLIRTVQELVAARFGVRLDPEVQLLGDLQTAER
jgi:UDP-N-acetylmuramate dehydrogenase